MKKCVAKCGFVPLDGSPGYFYNPNGAELVVYIDDFILISPRHLEKQIWKDLSKFIEFKNPPAPVDRFLGIYHNTSKLKDGTIQMITSAKQYLVDAVTDYLSETGVSSLAYVPTTAKTTGSMKRLPFPVH